MTLAEASFQESGGEQKVQSVPLAHLSIEIGHLYFEDLDAGPGALLRHFEQVKGKVDAIRSDFTARFPHVDPRISTCFMIDDYFGPSRSPQQVLPDLLEAIEASGLQLDYLAREAACARAADVDIAAAVAQQIVVEPPAGTDGSRPPHSKTGWLSNGQRTPAPRAGQAMGGRTTWVPPAQTNANRHHVLVEVQLWSDTDQGRQWSCAFLAAVWQLLRLGLLRYGGKVVAAPQPPVSPLPERWDRLPAVTRLNPHAAPFSAYRTMSVLQRRFLLTEAAVEVILAQTDVNGPALQQILDRAAGERLPVPPETVERIEYLFTTG